MEKDKITTEIDDLTNSIIASINKSSLHPSVILLIMQNVSNQILSAMNNPIKPPVSVSEEVKEV